MNCLVTGAAGFIGSHLCEHLLRDGHAVRGLDAFIPFYPRAVKETYLAPFCNHPVFTFFPLDLRTADLADALRGVDVVFHLAAMAGLPRSWTEFALYESCNVVGTQRLLEAAGREPLRRFIHISTSSVYGRYSSGDESLPVRPVSPYGVTKLAAENLGQAYAAEYNLPLVVMRYFSVYGPRQRPDMGYHRFIHALLHGETIAVFGDGLQARGNTYVDDCVAATVAAIDAPVGETYNVGGGETANVWEILEKLEKLTGSRAKVRREPARPGDQRFTFADTGKLQRHLNWQPRVGLDAGLARQVAWHRSLAKTLAA